MPNSLAHFSDPVQAWFSETFGPPTPPQAEGWPPIQRGEHTLILAPTGSGKTLAAFLWAIDQIQREIGAAGSEGKGEAKPGIRLLYVSPLKALNNDIERNLRAPLAGIRAAAQRLGQPAPPLRVAVRTGDTPDYARAQMLKQPPHILITTPESLYLMLTSPRARTLFRTVHTVIIDEIHTLCSTKRGVHLSLTLERLEHVAGHRIQRIGLSATQKPLAEVARFLGGQEWAPTPGPEQTVTGGPAGSSEESARHLVSRAVTIVNTGYKKPLDLQVVTAVADFRDLPGDSIWPAIIARLLGDIRRRRSTLIFTNNRRLAERTADRLNAQISAEETEEIEPGSTQALAPGGLVRDRGIFALGAQGPIRAHHGSMSRESRRAMEEDLKAGKLPALVGTSSLELGIDIGVVDQVVQLASPKSVAQGLQRVGRSGHMVGQVSRGRIYATNREDLVEAAAIARGMLEGDVEPTYTPQNPLDVLAQQIVAMVAVEAWPVPALYDLVRQAYAYCDLSEAAFLSVIEMLSGKFHRAAVIERRAGEPGANNALPAALRPRISWDRVNNRLAALPGSRLLAISNGGAIPDTGPYRVYLSDGKTKIGELDEEFVFETRVGDVFLLGSNTWRVLDITDDHVTVGDASGSTPRMPFWRGDYPWRPYELGERIGRFRGEIAARVAAAAGKEAEMAELAAWLRRAYALDDNSAQNLIAHVQRQIEALGVMSSDRTIVAEFFPDAVGEMRLVVHSPYGGRVNGAWALALRSALQERVDVEVEMQANDDGIIFRFPRLEGSLPVDILQTMTPAEARSRLLRELPSSAAFGAQFRMNASRALLLPRAHGGRRTPFWLQRLKARDLLAYVRQFEDFPLVAETYRDCLRDVFDLPHLELVLGRIQSGEIRVVPIETVAPSPVASDLLFGFINQYMYEWDAPKAERQLQTLAVRREAIEDLMGRAELSELLRPDALAEVVGRLQHHAPGYKARSVEELALALDELGDLTAAEIAQRCTGDAAGWTAELAAAGRVVQVAVPAPGGAETRWTPAELAGEYAVAGERLAAPEPILRRFLRCAGPVTRQAILDRYAFDPEWLDEMLARLVAARAVLKGRFTPTRDALPPPDEYCDPQILEQIHRRTLAVLRQEVQPAPLSAYAGFLLRWQHAHPDERLVGPNSLRTALQQLSGVALPAAVWERDVLPARLADYERGDLDALCGNGELVWVGAGRDPRRSRFRFFFRGEGGLFLAEPDERNLSEAARAVYQQLKTEGASFTADLAAGTGLRPSALEAALSELVMCGLVTNDAADTMRALVEPGQGPGANPAAAAVSDRAQAPRSALEAELAARMTGPRALNAGRYRGARRRVAQRLRAGPAPAAASAGRWSLVHRAGVMGRPQSLEERGLRLARLLLARYGVVTRDALEREDLAGDWPLLYAQLQRLEMRGEVRRGYFVAGLAGAQFALPEAVEKLRAGAAQPAEGTPVALNATDPANLYGARDVTAAATPGDAAAGAARFTAEAAFSFARVPSTWCVMAGGRLILVAEDSGARLTALTSDAALAKAALQAYLARPNAARHVVVSEWNGAPVLGSPGEVLLAEAGFYRSPAGMEWWVGR